MKRLLLLWVALAAFGEAMAARIDTVAVHSTAMHRELQALVVVPEAAAEKPMPVLYLLHGIGGDHSEWSGGKPDVVVGNLMAEGLAPEMIIVRIMTFFTLMPM